MPDTSQAFILVGDTWVRAERIESIRDRDHRQGAQVRTMSGASFAAPGQTAVELLDTLNDALSIDEPDVERLPLRLPRRRHIMPCGDDG